jgi:hypothetical protein
MTVKRKKFLPTVPWEQEAQHSIAGPFRKVRRQGD